MSQLQAAGLGSAPAGRPQGAPRQECSEDRGTAHVALELSPWDGALELRLARALAACQQYAESVEHYQHILQEQPQSASVLIALGGALFEAGRPAEAIPVFRQALQFVPNNLPAALGLARALAANGSYDEALRRYDDCLQSLPDGYDALQGKADTLYWAHRFAEARTIFESLQVRQPNDPLNAEALANMTREEEEARWAAHRPPAGSPSGDFQRYYQEQLQRDPHHHLALMGLAHVQVELGQYSAAIQTYSQVLVQYPNDGDAKGSLARLLGWNHQYDDSIRLYRELLSTAPQDIDTLEGLGRVLVWSGHLQSAADVYKQLLALRPGSPGYVFELGTLESRLGNFSDARQTFVSLLAVDPGNRKVRLQLARLELRQGDYADARNQFDQLLGQSPEDFDARLGEAQVYYYHGSLGRARALASALRKEQPNNFDVIFLLAAIERASRNRRAATALLDQCDRLDSNNPDVTALRERVRDESPAVLHTTAAFAREVGRPTQTGSTAQPEDLREYDFGTTLDLALLPRTDSSLSLSYLPSSSPNGDIQGTVGPSQFMYRQATRLFHLLTLRGGLGMVRFGPGEPQVLPGNPDPVPTATSRPIGFVGASLFPGKDLGFDLNWTRSAITYTPLSVRLGVIAETVEGAFHYFPTPRTEMHLTYNQGLYFSQMYEHVRYGIFQGEPVRIADTRADHQRGRGGSIVINQNFVRLRRFGWDLGYWGSAFGYDGPSHEVPYMGFFTPSFYQRHLLTTRLKGKLWGQVGYDFSGGAGVQQVEQGQALTRALTFSPAFTLRANSRLALGLEYTHYDSAPALGKVSGNAVRLSTDYKF